MEYMNTRLRERADGKVSCIEPKQRTQVGDELVKSDMTAPKEQD